jgi:hypothetical protein
MQLLCQHRSRIKWAVCMRKSHKSAAEAFDV